MEANKIYTTPEGKQEKVLMVDEINKMVYINVEGSNHRWVHEPEYSKWVATDTAADIPNIYIPDIPAQMTEEQAKTVSEKPKKKTIKKKTDDTNKESDIV